MEACVTLGMLTRVAGGAPQGRGARRLQPQPRHRAASTTGRSSRPARYDDRLRTLERVRAGGHHGLLAAASSAWARAPTTAARCCATLANLDPQPESVPINALVRVAGTPLDAPAAGRPARPRAHGRVRAHPHAARARPPLRRAHRAVARGAAARDVRRGELDLLRRQAADDARRHGNARRRAVFSARAANGR